MIGWMLFGLNLVVGFAGVAAMVHSLWVLRPIIPKAPTVAPGNMSVDSDTAGFT